MEASRRRLAAESLSPRHTSDRSVSASPSPSGRRKPAPPSGRKPRQQRSASTSSSYSHGSRSASGSSGRAVRRMRQPSRSLSSRHHGASRRCRRPQSASTVSSSSSGASTRSSSYRRSRRRGGSPVGARNGPPLTGRGGPGVTGRGSGPRNGAGILKPEGQPSGYPRRGGTRYASRSLSAHSRRSRMSRGRGASLRSSSVSSGFSDGHRQGHRRRVNGPAIASTRLKGPATIARRAPTARDPRHALSPRSVYSSSSSRSFRSRSRRYAHRPPAARRRGHGSSSSSPRSFRRSRSYGRRGPVSRRSPPPSSQPTEGHRSRHPVINGGDTINADYGERRAYPPRLSSPGSRRFEYQQAYSSPCAAPSFGYLPNSPSRRPGGYGTHARHGNLHSGRFSGNTFRASSGHPQQRSDHHHRLGHEESDAPCAHAPHSIADSARHPDAPRRQRYEDMSGPGHSASGGVGSDRPGHRTPSPYDGPARSSKGYTTRVMHPQGSNVSYRAPPYAHTSYVSRNDFRSYRATGPHAMSHGHGSRFEAHSAKSDRVLNRWVDRHQESGFKSGPLGNTAPGASSTHSGGGVGVPPGTAGLRYHGEVGGGPTAASAHGGRSFVLARQRRYPPGGAGATTTGDASNAGGHPVDRAATCPFLLPVIFRLHEHYSLEELTSWFVSRTDQKTQLEDKGTTEPICLGAGLKSPTAPGDGGISNGVSGTTDADKHDTTMVGATDANAGAMGPTSANGQTEREPDALFQDLSESQVDLYVWKNTSLREIVDLLKGDCPEARHRGSRLSIRLVHYENKNQYAFYDLGTLHASRPGPDDRRTLLRSQFEIGDALSVALLPATARRQKFPGFESTSSLQRAGAEAEEPCMDVKDAKESRDQEGQPEDEMGPLISQYPATLREDEDEEEEDDELPPACHVTVDDPQEEPEAPQSSAPAAAPAARERSIDRDAPDALMMSPRSQNFESIAHSAFDSSSMGDMHGATSTTVVVIGDDDED